MSAEANQLLVCRAGGRVVGLRVETVEEVLRPLPLEPLPDVPAFVRGACILRGRPTPVVDLAALLGSSAAERPRRMVSVKTTGPRRVGLLVSHVLGLLGAHEWTGDELPDLFADAAAGAIEGLARLDGSLLTVLRLGQVLPESIWPAGAADDPR